MHAERLHRLSDRHERAGGELGRRLEAGDAPAPPEAVHKVAANRSPVALRSPEVQDAGDEVIFVSVLAAAVGITRAWMR